MKKIYSLVLGLFLVALVFIYKTGTVNATTLGNDTADNIKFPVQYSISSKVTISNLSNYNTYYQVMTVDNNSSLSTAIDNYFKAQIELNKINDTTSTKYLEVKSQLDAYYNEVKSLVPDFNANDWATSVNENIYDNTVVTNTTTGRYVVWVRVTTANSTLYDFSFYSFNNYGTSVNNPETGFETTVLYLSVTVLVIIGSILIMSKNKERYE